jgi:hypothetical protein
MSNYSPNDYPAGRNKKVLYFFGMLVILLAIVVLFFDIEQNSPQFCSSCHTMRPEVYTWKASSHNRVGCIDCHRGDGIGGQLRFAADLARMAEATVLKNYVTPIRLFRSIDDERCFRCHSYNRQASVSGDLIIPHEDHTSSRVRCASCHSAVAHGDIARRKITQKVRFEDWDKDEGLQQMARELVQPSMDTCMSCHYRRKITTACDACHTDMTGPDNHLLTDFNVAHGSFAREELADCNSCHGYVGAKKLEVKENTDFIEYTRHNRFCFACHRKKPDSHNVSNFTDLHGKAITSGDREKDGCLVCHDNNISDIPQVTNLTCSECHPSKHGQNWRNRHLPPVLPGQKLSYQCFMCHSTSACLGCHNLPGYSDPFNSPPGGFAPNDLSTDFFM